MIYKDILHIALVIVLAAVLFWAAGYSKKYRGAFWRLLYIAPGLLLMFIPAYAGFEKTMILAYIGTVLLFLGFFTDKTAVRRILCGSAAAVTLLSVPAALSSKAYRKPDFLASFEEGFDEMKARYVLTEHKQINWDELYSKYHPQFVKIQNDHDEIANFAAWRRFCGEFHDAHVGYIPKDDSVVEMAMKKLFGNDYGLCILCLEDGSAAAVDVSDEVKAKGIHNGTVITAWDGMTPEEANLRSDAYGLLSYSDIDNEYFFRTELAAGVGGDTVEVTYIDDNGQEQKTMLSANGDRYYDRWEKAIMDKLDGGLNIGHLQWKKLTDETYCLRIKTMAYDSDTYTSTDYSKMKNELKEYILNAKKEGMKNIILDIRTNNGGDPYLCDAVAELVAAKGTYFHAYDAVWDFDNKCYAKDENGNYIRGDKLTVRGEDILDGGKVIVLVNHNSVSAADDMVMLMRRIPNATVMGFTESCGVCQAISSFSVDSGTICLSSCVVLDEDGSIFVDAGPDRQAKTKLDIRIPFDEEALTAIYDRGEDYLLDKALEQLDNR